MSSAELDRALRKLGFVAGTKSRGSHRSYSRQRPDGTHDTTTIVLGKKEIAKGTLRSILSLGNVTVEEFLQALR